MEKEIKEIVQKLFAENKIDILIGFGKGTIPLKTTPCFITEQANIEKLIWNSCCTNNLAVYLLRFFIDVNTQNHKNAKTQKIGIIAKRCDSRSILGLIKEHQVLRENLYIVGVFCDGMIDIKKIQNAGYKMQDNDIIEVKEKDNKIILIDGNKKETELKKEELIMDICSSCHKIPVIYDTLIGEKYNNVIRLQSYNVAVDEFEKKPIQARWKYFEEQISKCIRCYACRQACPNCYCKECFADQTKPKWIGKTCDLSDIMFYHIGRIFHQAGRCVDCGACVRACPMNIDLRMFTYKLVKDIQKLYNYEAGISLEEKLPLTTFSLNDNQEFITEP